MITPIKKIVISAIYILSCCMSTNAKEQYGDYYPEAIVADYPFMVHIADIVKKTDMSITAKQGKKIIPKDNCIYHMRAYGIRTGGQFYKSQHIDFDKDGSYFILLSYEDWYDGIIYDSEYIFNISSIVFKTSIYLNKFVLACKVKKTPCFFDCLGMPTFTSCFWDFEIRNGKVANAFYIYEENELDLLNNPVYDLLNNRFITYGDLIKLYPQYYHTEPCSK